jgi:hypothetical protein
MEDTHVAVLVIILFHAHETNKCCCCYIVRVWRSPAQYYLKMTIVASSSALFIAALAFLFAAPHFAVSVRRCQACSKGRSALHEIS